MNKYNKWTDLNGQFVQALTKVRMSRGPGDYTREDWIDSMMYGLFFGTPEEIARMQLHARHEAEREHRPYTPVFWTANEQGAEPVLTLWRIK